MQPREKFLRRTIDALSDEELIAILLSTGTKGRDFQKLSKDVFRQIKNLSKISDIFSSIKGLKGVGDVKAMRIVSGIELGKRLFGRNESHMIRILTSDDAYQYLKYMSRYKQEHFVSVYLNARYEVLLKETISIGQINTVSVQPRDIIIPGLECNCAYVIIAHNHPSGGSSPSTQDIEVTERIKKAMEIVGMKFLDHLVIGGDGWSSVELGGLL